MIELNNKEQLIYFMATNLRLSRYDIRFLQNLEKITLSKKRITSNQSDLVNKLIEKYERQFVKNQMFIKELLNLPWKTLAACNVPITVKTFTRSPIASAYPAVPAE